MIPGMFDDIVRLVLIVGLAAGVALVVLVVLALLWLGFL